MYSAPRAGSGVWQEPGEYLLNEGKTGEESRNPLRGHWFSGIYRGLGDQSRKRKGMDECQWCCLLKDSGLGDWLDVEWEVVSPRQFWTWVRAPGRLAVASKLYRPNLVWRGGWGQKLKALMLKQGRYDPWRHGKWCLGEEKKSAINKVYSLQHCNRFYPLVLNSLLGWILIKSNFSF